MICCCAHHASIHAPPAAQGEGLGKCSKPGCECGLFEADSAASARQPVPESSRPLAACGCVEITFLDGRRGRQNCVVHCFEELAKGFQNLGALLANLAINFGRLGEIEAVKIAERVRRENELLLGQPAPGPRRIS